MWVCEETGIVWCECKEWVGVCEGKEEMERQKRRKRTKESGRQELDEEENKEMKKKEGTAPNLPISHPYRNTILGAYGWRRGLRVPTLHKWRLGGAAFLPGRCFHLDQRQHLLLQGELTSILACHLLNELRLLCLDSYLVNAQKQQHFFVQQLQKWLMVAFLVWMKS